MVIIGSFKDECLHQLPNYHLECKIYPWDTYLMAITYRESIWT